MKNQMTLKNTNTANKLKKMERILVVKSTALKNNTKTESNLWPCLSIH